MTQRESRRPGDRRGRRDRHISSAIGTKLGAEVLGRALQFLLVYLTQRVLGPETYGHFTFAMAVGIVLAPLADLGVQLTVTRELAKGERDAESITGAGLVLRLPLIVLIGGVVVLVSRTRVDEVQLATMLLGLALVVGTMVDFVGYVFRGFQRVDCEAALTLGGRILTVTLGTAALWRGWGLVGVATGYLLGNVITATVGYTWLRWRFVRPRLTAGITACSGLLREALPLGGAIFLSLAYTRTSVFMLDSIHGAEAVGLYGVALRLIEPLAIIPAAVMAAVFPVFTRRLSADAAASDALGRKSTALLGGAGALIALAGFIGAPPILELLYGGQYEPSTQPLRFLSLTVLFTFVNYGLTHFLIAHGRQRLNLVFSGIVFGVNLGLCLIVIPRLGPSGAAVAVLVSEIVLFGLCWGTLRGIRVGRRVMT